MAPTASASNNGVGAINLTYSGVAASSGGKALFEVFVQFTDAAGSVYRNDGGTATSGTRPFTGLAAGTGSWNIVAIYGDGGVTDTDINVGSGSIAVTPSGSASASTGTDTITISWASVSSTYDGSALSYIAVAAGNQSANCSGASGSQSFTAVGSVSWSATAYYANGAAVGLGSGTVTVLDHPPTPAAPTNVAITADSGSSVTVGWTASPGGAGYTIQYVIRRNGTVIATVTGTSYADGSSGSARPITYSILPESVGDGTTYSGTQVGTAASVTDGSADSCGILMG